MRGKNIEFRKIMFYHQILATNTGVAQCKSSNDNSRAWKIFYYNNAISYMIQFTTTANNTGVARQSLTAAALPILKKKKIFIIRICDSKTFLQEGIKKITTQEPISHLTLFFSLLYIRSHQNRQEKGDEYVLGSYIASS